jgi:hypothetical protein
MKIARLFIFHRMTLMSVFLSSMAGGAAFGAHPLITDDTGTQGKGKFQLEMNGKAARDKEILGGVDTREESRELAVALASGATDTVDLVVGLPWIRSRMKENGATVSDESGAGDASLEVKWRFLDRGGFSLAMKPGLTLPTGNEERGLGNGRPSFGLTLIATQKWERSFLDFNMGFARSSFELEADRESNRRGTWSASIAVGAEVVKELTMVANIGAETNGDKGSDTWPAFLLGGLIYSVTETLDVDLGIKKGLNRPEADLSVLAGAAWRF